MSAHASVDNISVTVAVAAPVTITVIDTGRGHVTGSGIMVSATTVTNFMFTAWMT